MGAIGQAGSASCGSSRSLRRWRPSIRWSEFRQEWSNWLFGRLGNVTEAGDPYSSPLTWEVVAEETVGDRTRATVAVALRGEPVAEFVMVSLPDWPAASEEDGGGLYVTGTSTPQVHPQFPPRLGTLTALFASLTRRNSASSCPPVPQTSGFVSERIGLASLDRRGVGGEGWTRTAGQAG
jgi:hypothetical protein